MSRLTVPAMAARYVSPSPFDELSDVMARRQNLRAAAVLSLISLGGRGVCVAAATADGRAPGAAVGTTPNVSRAHPAPVLAGQEESPARAEVKLTVDAIPADTFEVSDAYAASESGSGFPITYPWM